MRLVGNNKNGLTGLEHHISASDTTIFVDGVPKKIELVDKFSIRIGCTTVDISAVKRIYNALSTFGCL